MIPFLLFTCVFDGVKGNNLNSFLVFTEVSNFNCINVITKMSFYTIK